MKKKGSGITIVEALESLGRVNHHKFPPMQEECVPSFYCYKYSGGRMNGMICQGQCDACKKQVDDRQAQTRAL